MSSEDILTSEPPAADRRVFYGPDPSQFVDIRLPHEKGIYPVVFFIHGGYWRSRYDLTYAGHLCHALKRAGIGTWNIEYRRVGNLGGWPATFVDVHNAYRMLQKTGDRGESQLDLKRVCVAGHSAGGQLALCLAVREPAITRVLSLAGVLNLHRAWELHLSNDAVREFLGGSPTDVPARYREASPAEQQINARQVLIHGTDDDSVPYEIGRSYWETKKQAGENATLITMPETGHFEIVDPAAAVWSRVQQIFIELTQ